MSPVWREIAPAKLNLALHVRGKLPDGRHAIETVFAFCADGDRLSAQRGDDISLSVEGPFAGDVIANDENLVIRAAKALANKASVKAGVSFVLDKRLPVASGIGGGSADAAAALRLLTSMWSVDPSQAEAVAPGLGSDVPACLPSLPMRGDGVGDVLTLVDLHHLSETPVLVVNPRVQLSTAEVFAHWDGVDQGPLDSWHDGRNDLEQPAIELVPQIETVLAWLRTRPGANFVRMSGSGASCFALFDSECARDEAAEAVPREWWRLATYLR